MPFNADGSFSRVRGPDSWKDDATATTPIKADLHDINDQDLANGLSDTITRTGKSQPTADIPMNNHKLVNLAQPGNPQDAATKRYVDEMPGWPNSKSIGGADVDGRLNFTSTTGANGITWSNIGAAWLARPFIVDKERNRVVLNNAVDGSGTDVIAISDIDGSIAVPSQFEVSTNLIYDGSTPTPSWRTPVAGTGGLLQKTATALSMLANSVATTVAYGVAILETWFQVYRNGGSVVMAMDKKADTDIVAINGSKNGVLRWILSLGNGTAEDGTFHGSDFTLTSCNNSGVANFTPIVANRANGKVQFAHGITGVTNFDNRIVTTNGQLDSTTAMVVGGAAGVYLRPTGAANVTNQTILGTDGLLTVAGYIKSGGIWERPGTSGSYGTQVFNFNYNSSTDIRVYVGTTFAGTITPACDYRIKREVQPLPSSWEAVKALRPVRYLDAAYGGEESLFRDGDTERWGFLAHELQDALLPSAATGEHDGPDLQVPNHITVIAALTSALQEAMRRIEALESRP